MWIRDNRAPTQPTIGIFIIATASLASSASRSALQNCAPSIEKLDDIAFHESLSSPDVARDLLQVKHHVNRAGGLGDSSPDIWKTLRIWAEAVANNRIDLDQATLCLLTTSTPTIQNALTESFAGNFHVNDVSDDGTVVVGTCCGGGFDGRGDDGFRWTESGGFERLEPAGSLNNGNGSYANGVSPDGSTIAGSRTTDGPTLWRDSLQPTSTLPVTGITNHGGEPGVRGSATDVIVDLSGNTWSSGGYGFIWRNEEIVYQEEFHNLNFNNVPGIALTDSGVRAIASGSAFFPVFGIAQVYRIVDFPNADPMNPIISGFPFQPSNISTDGTVIVGQFRTQDAANLSLAIWEDGSGVWGIASESNVASVQLLLQNNLPAEQQEVVRLPEWQFKGTVVPGDATSRDVAMHRNRSLVKSTILSRGVNPDGVIESFLVSVATVDGPVYRLDVSYSSGEVLSGPLIDGLTELPAMVNATFLLNGIPTDTSFGLQDVLSFALSFGDQTLSANDLKTFSLSKAQGADGAITELTYSGTSSTGIQFENFPLLLFGTDGVSGQAFEYRYSTSAQTLTFVPEPASLPLGLMAIITVLRSRLRRRLT